MFIYCVMTVESTTIVIEWTNATISDKISIGVSFFMEVRLRTGAIDISFCDPRSPALLCPSPFHFENFA